MKTDTQAGTDAVEIANGIGTADLLDVMLAETMMTGHQDEIETSSTTAEVEQGDGEIEATVTEVWVEVWEESAREVPVLRRRRRSRHQTLPILSLSSNARDD